MLLIGLLGLAINERNEVAGTKRVGKSSFEAFVKQEFPHTRAYAFADDLKSMLAAYFGVSVAAMEEDKALVRPELGNVSWRFACETFGTVTKQVTGNERYWLDRVLRKLERKETNFPEGLPKALEAAGLVVPLSPTPEEIVLVTDVRTYEEYATLKNQGAFLLRIQRVIPGAVSTGHATDQLDHRMQPDATLENYGSLEDFRILARCQVLHLLSRRRSRSLVHRKPFPSKLQPPTPPKIAPR